MEEGSSIVASTKATGKEIMTEAEHVSLAAITESDIGKTIYVKVYRKWTITNKQGKPVMFCCMLLDKQGGAIEVNINIREKQTFDAALQINKAYKITGFGFQPARTWMQTIHHPLSLVFGNQTDIQPIPDTDFPSHYFRFTQYKDLYSRVDKKGLLTDYVGITQYVTGIQQVVKPTGELLQWRDIGIQNLDGLTVRFTLWSNKAHSFNMEEYETAEKPVVIAVASCSVKLYGGLQLSSTSATEYYFNPDIPENDQIRSVYSIFLEPPVISNVQRERCANPEEEKQRNRVTLSDLLKENPANQQSVRFTVEATIQRIDNSRPWYFKKCLTCKEKINERYPHAHCKVSVSETDPNCSYCFRLLLSDATGNIYLTCFSNEANSMVKDCNELIRTLEDKDRYKYPQELLALEGQTKIFQLHFASESTKEKPVFFLDKAWDNTPLLTAGSSTIAKNVKAPLPPNEPSEQIKLDTSTLAKNKEIVTSSATLSPPPPLTQNLEQHLPATPPEESNLLPGEPQKEYGPRKTSVRRSLYSEETATIAEKSQKK